MENPLVLPEIPEASGISESSPTMDIISPRHVQVRQGRQQSAPVAKVTGPGPLHGRSRFAPADAVEAASGQAPTMQAKRTSSVREEELSFPVATQRARRSSWAPDHAAVEAQPQGAQPQGLEALCPEDLYRQFVAIRNAVLQRAGTVATPAATTDTPTQPVMPSEDLPTDPHGSNSASQPAHHLPDPDQISAVLLPTPTQRQPLAPAAVTAAAPSDPGSPAIIDLQQYFRSPDNSFSGAVGPAAFPSHLGQASQDQLTAEPPFVQGSTALEPLSLGRSDSEDRDSAGASTSASYDGRSTRSRGSGRKEADAGAETSGAEMSERGSGRSSADRQGGKERARVEGCLPERTDSLFSLATMSTELPREGPCRANVIAAGGQGGEVEERCGDRGDGGGRGRRRSVEVVVVQEDLSCSATQPGLSLNLQGTRPKGPKAALSVQPEDGGPLVLYPNGPEALNQCRSELSTSRTCLADEGQGLGTDHLPSTEVALSSPVASADYMEAVRSAATGPELGTSGPRTSAPASASSSSRSMAAGPGAATGGNPASGDSGSGTGGTTGAEHGGSGGAAGGLPPAAGTVPLPAGVPSGYIPLPLPRPALQAAPGSPVVPAVGATAGGSCYRLPATRSIVWTSRSVVERCLDKGVPFAAMTEEQFVAVAAAAEQHDCALAYHLLSFTAVVYPGIGRHAASSGGAGGQTAAAEAPSSPASPRWRLGSLGHGAGAAAAAGLGLGLLGRRQGAGTAATAATDAARKVRALLYGGAMAGEQQPEEGEVALEAAAAVGAPGGAGLQQLHVFSTAEYQRLLLAAQYGIRHLHEMLVAQPAVVTAAAAAAALPLTPVAQTPTATEPGDAAVQLPPLAVPGLACSSGASAVPLEVPRIGSPGGSMGLSASPPTRGMGLLSLGSLLRGGGTGTGAGPTAAGSGSFGGHRRATSIGSDSSFSMAVTAGLGGAGSGPGGASGPLPMSRFQSHREGSTAAAVVAALSPRSRSRKVPCPSDGAALSAVAALREHRVRALAAAAQLGNVARVAYLVEHGADVNATDSPASPGVLRTAGGGGGGCRTALHHAAEAGSFAVVQLLLHHGAFVGVRDNAGRTAYDLARRKGHDVVAALLREAADQQRDMVRSRTLAEGRSAAAAAAVGAAGGAAGVLAAAAAHLFSRGSDAEQQQEQREGDQGGKEAVVRKGTGVVGGVSVKGEGLVAVATATATAATVAAADPEISAVAHCEIQQDVGAARNVPEQHAPSGDAVHGKLHGPKVPGGGAGAQDLHAIGSGDKAAEAPQAAEQLQGQQQAKPKARRGGLFACFACGA